jgi:hypothetical protein
MGRPKRIPDHCSIDEAQIEPADGEWWLTCNDFSRHPNDDILNNELEFRPDCVDPADIFVANGRTWGLTSNDCMVVQNPNTTWNWLLGGGDPCNRDWMDAQITFLSTQPRREAELRTAVLRHYEWLDSLTPVPRKARAKEPHEWVHYDEVQLILASWRARLADAEARAISRELSKDALPKRAIIVYEEQALEIVW